MTFVTRKASIRKIKTKSGFTKKTVRVKGSTYSKKPRKK